MDYEREIQSLAAESAALQLLLINLVVRLSRLGQPFDIAVRDTFEEAANQAEYIAIRLGKSANPEHTIECGRIIEKLRTVVFPDQVKPHGLID